MAPVKSNTKRIQVDSNKRVIFIIVSVAAFLTVSALVISKGLWSQTAYLDKVATKKEAAVKQLEDNKESVVELQKKYIAFKEQNPNLLGGSTTGNTEKDGDNAKLILDALPNQYDFPAVATSVEQLTKGFRIDGLKGVDDYVIQRTNTAAGPVEMPFTVDITANYDGIKTIINSFDKSIRPFSFTKLEFKGTNAELKLVMSLKTFYEPDKGLEITKEEVQ